MGMLYQYRVPLPAFTYMGTFLYDLSTLPEARGKGHAGALIDHICELAKEKRL